MTKTDKIIRKPELARAIYDVMEGYGLVRQRPRTGKAHKIVEIIFKTITEALQRGESVRIDGLGKFRVYTRIPTKTWGTFFYGRPNGPRILLDLPPKKLVTFRAANSITRALNQEISNGKS